jgi:membrane fusion protein (multidrug efflux system)
VLEKVEPSGKTLKKDELIAKIENKEIESQYNLIKESVEIARVQLMRAEELFRVNNVSRKELEDSKTRLIEANKAYLNIKSEYDYIFITAPFDGVVASTKKRMGTEIRKGEIITTFYDPQDLVLEFDIPSNILNLLKGKNKIKVYENIIDLPDIPKIIDPNTHSTPVQIDYNGSNLYLGENIDIDLILNEKENVIVIPYEAVFLKNGKEFVYVVEENKAALKPVKLGIRDKDRVEIIEGINVNDKVIIRGQSRLYPGVRVKQ